MRIIIRNAISRPIHRCISILVFLFVCSAGLAADFNMWVGETGSYEMSGAGYYNFRLTRVSCAQSSIVCNTVGWVAKWTIKQYFSGTATIVIEYAYQVSQRDSYKNGTKTLTVSCRDNQVSITPSSLSLEPGQHYDLNHSFQYPSKVSGPSLQWSTDDWSGKIITVSSSGRVTAKGPGTATVYLDHNQGSNRGTCVVTVKQVEPESVYLNDISLAIDETRRLSPTVYPDGATTTFTWWSNNESIAYVDQSGNVTGRKEGTTSVNVRTANGKTASCNVTVTKPRFYVASSSPAASATGVSVLSTITVTFSSQPQWAGGKSGSDITLTNTSNNSKVAGSATLSGKNLVFTPQKALEPQTNYRLTIPANTLVDQYGTTYTSVYELNFKTGDLEKLTVTASLDEGWVQQGTIITLSASYEKAEIRITTDGKAPTKNSQLYSSPITISEDLTLKAIAYCDGFEESEILSKKYMVSTLQLNEVFPTGNSKEIGRYISPYLLFNENISKGDNIDKVSLLRNDSENVIGTIVISDRKLYFVPSEELKSGSYKFLIPAGAVQSDKKEQNVEISSYFVIDSQSSNAIMGAGCHQNYVVKSDNSLWGWGGLYPISSSVPKKMMDDIIYVAAGENGGNDYVAVIKTDGTLWTFGGNEYGQLGNGTTEYGSSPTQVMSEVESVVGDTHMLVLKKDGTVWACGYNYCGQLGNGKLKSTVNKTLTQVNNLTNVTAVAASFQQSAAITSDGDLWVWGQLGYSGFGSNSGLGGDITSPRKLMSNVKYVSLGNGGLAIKTDNTLWSWGWYTKPIKIMDDVVYATHGFVIKMDGTLYHTSTENTGYDKVLSDVKYVWVANNNVGAIKTDGSVWTWGTNENYGLGTGGSLSDTQLTPVQIIEGKKPCPLIEITIKEKDTIRLQEGKQHVIEYELKPWNADYNQISFVSSNPEVAAVDSRGIVTAKAYGTATISLTADNMTATCEINVTNTPAITITAKSYSREYGEENPELKFDVSGGSITGTPKLTCSATKYSDVGTYTIVVEKGTVQGDVKLVDGTLTVTKAPLTVRANDCERYVGEENPVFTLSYSGWKNGQNESVLTTKPTATCSATKDSPVGTYPIKVSGGSARNYEFNHVSGTLTVKEKTSQKELKLVVQPNGGEVKKGTKVRIDVTTTDDEPVEGAKIIVDIIYSPIESVSYVKYRVPFEVTIDGDCSMIVSAFKDGFTSAKFSTSYTVVEDDTESDYMSLGKGTLYDDFFEKTTDVKILQHKEKSNYYCVLRPYDGITNEVQGVDYKGSDSLFIYVLGPGWSLMDVPITIDGLVYFDDCNTGYYHREYKDDIWILHPSRFIGYDNENDWLYNRVLSYQENGMPKEIQLAPYYYLFNVGGWPYTDEDGILIITFPLPSSIKNTYVEGKEENSSVYSLSGQRLAAPRKGVNIIGGKKVVVK